MLIFFYAIIFLMEFNLLIQQTYDYRTHVSHGFAIFRMWPKYRDPYVYMRGIFVLIQARGIRIHALGYFNVCFDHRSRSFRFTMKKRKKRSKQELFATPPKYMCKSMCSSCSRGEPCTML